MIFAIGLVLSFLISALLVPEVRKLAIMIGAVDNPKEASRKIHKKVMARGGGVAIYISFVVVCLMLLGTFPKQFIGLLVAGSMVLAIGLVDDVRRLSPWVKLLVQLLAALIASIGFGITIDNITNPFGNTLVFVEPTVSMALWGVSISFNWIAVALSVLWLVGMTNTINFLDGIDGLSGGVSAIAAGIIFLLAMTDKVNQPATALVSIILAGGCLGFLVYNFYPAKIFNGDSGAYFLGMTLGILAIFSGATWSVLRRLAHRKSPFTADRGHLHYLFLDAGFSQRQAVMTIYVLCLAFGLIGIVGSSQQKILGIILLFIVMAALLVGLAYLKRIRSQK